MRVCSQNLGCVECSGCSQHFGLGIFKQINPLETAPTEQIQNPFTEAPNLLSTVSDAMMIYNIVNFIQRL